MSLHINKYSYRCWT